MQRSGNKELKLLEDRFRLGIGEAFLTVWTVNTGTDCQGGVVPPSSEAWEDT